MPAPPTSPAARHAASSPTTWHGGCDARRSASSSRSTTSSSTSPSASTASSDSPIGDFEVLLVDDGSPDGSRAIAERYAARDSRFRLVTRPNGGLGAARNTGVRNARGRYLTFVDSDDTLPSGALAALIDSAHRTGSDIVAGSMERFDSLKVWTPKWVPQIQTIPRERRADRGLPAAPAQPLHLRQAVPPRLLGRAGTVVPRGRGLRGPADRHPAAGPGRGHRRAARHRLPLPRARRPELDQPADGVPEGSPRPDRGLDDQPRGPARGGLGRGVRRLAGHAVRRALPVVPRQPGHRRRRLLDRARGRRTRSSPRDAPDWVWEQTAPRSACWSGSPSSTAGPTPRSSCGRGAAGRPMAGHGPRGRDPAATCRCWAHPGSTRTCSCVRPEQSRSPTRSRRSAGSTAADGRPMCQISGWAYLTKVDLTRPRLDGERRPAPRADR